MPRVQDFRLRLAEAELADWASLYPKESDADAERIGMVVRARGYLLQSELRGLARWKSPRIGSRIDRNGEGVVLEVTRMALSTSDTSLAIRSLQLLEGVGWPMASVILHFCAPAKYPVLDVRALWTVGCDRLPPYSTTLWLRYTYFCRELADRTGLSMRDVDRGLWQYSKDRGRSAG